MMNSKMVKCYVAVTIIMSCLCSIDAKAASEQPDNVVPKEVFDGMRKNFHAEKSQDVQVRYAFQLSGPDGGEWFVEVSDGKCKIDKGKIDNPDVTFIASDKDWVALSNGKLKGWWAYLTGRLKIRGDQNLARKLGEMFN
jgi:putative sterol carrier protein